MKKTHSLLIFFCFAPMLLTGCWDKVEVSDLAIITAAAIDQFEDDKIRISVQLFIPRSISSGESGEDPSQGSTFVREGIGDNLAQAISKLQNSVPRELFWGHCKIYIFGEKLAENGIRKGIDYLVRHPSPRGSSHIYISKGEASEIMSLTPPLERYSSEALIKLTLKEKGMKTTLMDVDKALMGEGESVSLPYISKLESQEPSRKTHETIPVIVGTAILKKDKLVGTLNNKETSGLLWLKDDVKESTISVQPEEEDGKITMIASTRNIIYNPQIFDGSWKMNIHIDMDGDIVQNETHLNLMNENTIEKLTLQFEAVLKDRIDQTIEKIQQEYNADVIGFGKRFHQRYAKAWNEEKENWDEKFLEVEVDVIVHATIKRPGYIGPPAALPIDEVEEVMKY